MNHHRHRHAYYRPVIERYRALPVPNDKKDLISSIFDMRDPSGHQAHKRSKHKQAYLYFTHGADNADEKYFTHPLFKRVWTHPRFNPFGRPTDDPQQVIRNSFVCLSDNYTFHAVVNGSDEASIVVDTTNNDTIANGLLRVLLLLEDENLSIVRTELEGIGGLSSRIDKNLIPIIMRLMDQQGITRITQQEKVLLEEDVRKLVELLSKCISITQRQLLKTDQQTRQQRQKITRFNTSAQSLISNLSEDWRQQHGSKTRSATRRATTNRQSHSGGMP